MDENQKEKLQPASKSGLSPKLEPAQTLCVKWMGITEVFLSFTSPCEFKSQAVSNSVLH